jgi:nucleoside-diphosphate-sugar epimerase
MSIMELHTILGANGTIARELLPVLLEHNKRVRLVSRSASPVEGAEVRKADVLNAQQLLQAVEGSSVVYLVIGIQYHHKVWQRDWPVIMRNVIDACKANNAKLIFFDDVYMYGKVDGVITEETPYRPTSKKGKVRAEVALMLQREMQTGSVRAAIARAVDFYGPRVTDKSAAGILVFTNMKKGKKAQWFINADVPRSVNFTPDAARAMYILGTHDKAIGEIWHLPSVQPALTGRAFVKLAAKYMNASDKVMVLPKWLLKVIGWFDPFMKEAYEMNYQDEYPFRFSSAKFEKAFGFTPTSYEEGIKVTAAWYKQQ